MLILTANILLQFNVQDSNPAATQTLSNAKETEELESNEKTVPQDEQNSINSKTIEEVTPVLFQMINHVFCKECPKATIKIGLIYLAKIMDFYPDFTQKYLQVLLESPENIRSTILEMDPLPGTEEEVYVSGANTDKYRTYGAP